MSTMRVLRTVALASVLAGCARPTETDSIGKAEQRFTSDQAVLLDFTFDGSLVADTNDVERLKTLIHAQLMYSVGQLNGERSVGRHEKLELSAITAAPMGSDRYAVSYHAKLPVAWGGKAVPASYAFALPARVGEADQIAFATKYGSSCVDASAGPGEMHPGRMFLFYRPRQPQCVLDQDDVSVFLAKVNSSSETPKGKYPEYHRIWEDKTLDVVAIFSRAQYEPTEADEGVHAYEEFLQHVSDWVNGLGTTNATASSDPNATSVNVTLADGRRIRIHARLVGADLATEKTFDTWYDALTPDADMIFYSGHAGLGANVRSLMTKGSFQPKKYVVWAANGCDTFAYIDRTLADRRAKLNPDDPSGTKYMDVVSNVMAGYFSTGPETSMAFLEAIIEAGDPKRAPKTYRQIFENIDPAQVIVVTGEEDNEFAPAPPAPAPAATPPAQPIDDDPPAPSSTNEDPIERPRSIGCSLGASSAASAPLAALVMLVMTMVRRRLRARSASVGG